jgi:hypothetical protein
MAVMVLAGGLKTKGDQMSELLTKPGALTEGSPPPFGYTSWEGGEKLTSLSERSLKRLAKQGKLRVFHPTPGRSLLSVRELLEFIETTAAPIGAAEEKSA